MGEECGGKELRSVLCFKGAAAGGKTSFGKTEAMLTVNIL